MALEPGGALISISGLFEKMAFESQKAPQQNAAFNLNFAQNQSNVLPLSISPNSIESNVDSKEGSVHNGTDLSLPTQLK